MKRVLIPGLTTALVTALVTASAALAAPAGASTVHATGHLRTQARTSHAAGPRAAAIRSAANLVASRPPTLKVSGHDRFHTAMVVSSHGLQYVAYTRSYRGLPVVGGDFVVATDSRGQILTTSVAQTRPVHLASVKPAISRARARATSQRLVSSPRLGASRLVVLQRTGSQLAWATTVSGLRHGEASKLSVYVSARTGKVLSTKEHVADGTGNTTWEGNVTFPTTQSGSTYSMTNPTQTSLTCQDAANNTTFTGPDDAWGNGDETNRETDCADAMYDTDQERLMLSAWDGRNGMDGNGGWVPIRVGLADVNAYYDGSQVQVGHTQTGGKWIGEIDVIAHEFGHGIDDHTPGGISGKGTQEFVADTFGAATEWYANNPVDRPDYTVGEQVNLVGNGPIRYMYNPSLAGDSNCYSSSTPNAEVHSAAGVGNHWFYLVAEGTSPTDGQPTSPTCNSTTIAGIGIASAEKIMYNAMLLKTTGASYLKYRTWTLTAAKNLFPGSCAQFNVVKAAWDAVSVPAQAGDPTCTTQANTVTVTNPGAQTGTVGVAKSVQVTASDSASGQTLTYSATGLPAGESISASTGLISGTPTTAGSYSVTVTATDTTGASGSTSFTWTVNPAAANTVTVTNPGAQTGTVGVAKSVQITASDSASGQTLTYSATGLPAGESINASTGLISGTPTTAGSYSVTVTAKDTTNATGSTSFTWTINPAAANTVTVTNPGTQTGTVGTAQSVQIAATDSASGQTLTYSATGLPAGESINASTGLISGTPTTAGSYTVSVSAKDTTNATGSTSFTWTINPAGTGCSSPGQKLGNTGFETGTAAPWTSSAGVVSANGNGQTSHSGTYFAWLDGYGKSHTDTLSQSVTIPAGCHATLSFYLHIDSAESTTSRAYDTLTVKFGTGSFSYSNLNKATGYTLRTFDVSSYAGQTVTLSFTGVEDSSLQTSFVVDDATLTTS